MLALVSVRASFVGLSLELDHVRAGDRVARVAAGRGTAGQLSTTRRTPACLASASVPARSWSAPAPAVPLRPARVPALHRRRCRLAGQQDHGSTFARPRDAGSVALASPGIRATGVDRVAAEAGVAPTPGSVSSPPRWRRRPRRAAGRPALAGDGGHVRLGPGADGRRAGQARSHRGRVAPRREPVTHVCGELDGRLGRARLAAGRRSAASRGRVAGRGYDHHHAGDRDHHNPGSSGQVRPPGVLPAYHGRHLCYPVSLGQYPYPYSYSGEKAAINTTVRPPDCHRGLSPRTLRHSPSR